MVPLRLAWVVSLLGLLLVWTSGCATRHKIDWAARVGLYTHDDAIRELGPPDKSARLSDGSVVEDWMTARGTQLATVYGAGWQHHRPYGWYGVPGYVAVDPPTPDRYLRLTFDPQGKLASWQRIAR